MPGKPRIRPPSGDFEKVRSTIRKLELRTVCQESHCPNLPECWSSGTATFLILGDTCTRSCRFCNTLSAQKGKPLDPSEPERLARAVKEWKLDYVVLTSVDRDDLFDKGANHFFDCIKAVKQSRPGILVEVLIPDFGGEKRLLELVTLAKPDAIAHNIEVVEPLQKEARDPRASYEQSLQVLENVKKLNPEICTKSSLLLGLGETEKEVLQAMKDLRSVRVDFLVLGQYLRPSKSQLPVKEFLPKEKFDFFREKGKELGFKHVTSEPLARTSYRAGELFLKNFR